jgi:hypothetical protein
MESFYIQVSDFRAIMALLFKKDIGKKCYNFMVFQKQDNGKFSVAGMKDSIDITDLLELRGDENRLRISFIKSHVSKY